MAVLSKVENISPSTAKMYLEACIHNRKLRGGTVDLYASQMKSGKWQLTHQGIAFSENGELRDGQHRLSAIIRSGCTIPMYVTRGVRDDCSLVLDTHAKRSVADCISLYTGTTIDNSHVAVINAVMSYAVPGNVTKAWRGSNDEILSLLTSFNEPIEFVSRCKLSSKNHRGVASAPVISAFAMAWFYENDLERLRYAIGILTGDELPDGESDRAMNTLRTFLLTAPRSAVRAFRRDVSWKSQRAIKAFMTCEPLTKLYATEPCYVWPLTKDAIRK